jgi:cbb3-type cytochrome oxidase subunit 3
MNAINQSYICFASAAGSYLEPYITNNAKTIGYLLFPALFYCRVITWAVYNKHYTNNANNAKTIGYLLFPALFYCRVITLAVYNKHYKNNANNAKTIGYLPFPALF